MKPKISRHEQEQSGANQHSSEECDLRESHSLNSRSSNIHEHPQSEERVLSTTTKSHYQNKQFPAFPVVTSELPQLSTSSRNAEQTNLPNISTYHIDQMPHHTNYRQSASSAPTTSTFYHRQFEPSSDMYYHTDQSNQQNFSYYQPQHQQHQQHPQHHHQQHHDYEYEYTDEILPPSNSGERCQTDGSFRYPETGVNKSNRFQENVTSVICQEKLLDKNIHNGQKWSFDGNRHNNHYCNQSDLNLRGSTNSRSFDHRLSHDGIVQQNQQKQQEKESAVYSRLNRTEIRDYERPQHSHSSPSTAPIPCHNTKQHKADIPYDFYRRVKKTESAPVDQRVNKSTSFSSVASCNPGYDFPVLQPSSSVTRSLECLPAKRLSNDQASRRLKHYSYIALELLSFILKRRCRLASEALRRLREETHNNHKHRQSKQQQQQKQPLQQQPRQQQQQQSFSSGERQRVALIEQSKEQQGTLPANRQLQETRESVTQHGETRGDNSIIISNIHHTKSTATTVNNVCESPMRCSSLDCQPLITRRTAEENELRVTFKNVAVEGLVTFLTCAVQRTLMVALDDMSSGYESYKATSVPIEHVPIEHVPIEHGREQYRHQKRQDWQENDEDNEDNEFNEGVNIDRTARSLSNANSEISDDFSNRTKQDQHQRIDYQVRTEGKKFQRLLGREFEEVEKADAVVSHKVSSHINGEKCDYESDGFSITPSSSCSGDEEKENQKPKIPAEFLEEDWITENKQQQQGHTHSGLLLWRPAETLKNATLVSSKTSALSMDQGKCSRTGMLKMLSILLKQTTKSVISQSFQRWRSSIQIDAEVEATKRHCDFILALSLLLQKKITVYQSLSIHRLSQVSPRQQYRKRLAARFTTHTKDRDALSKLDQTLRFALLRRFLQVWSSQVGLYRRETFPKLLKSYKPEVSRESTENRHHHCGNSSSYSCLPSHDSRFCVPMTVPKLPTNVPKLPATLSRFSHSVSAIDYLIRHVLLRDAFQRMRRNERERFTRLHWITEDVHDSKEPFIEEQKNDELVIDIQSKGILDDEKLAKKLVTQAEQVGYWPTSEVSQFDWALAQLQQGTTAVVASSLQQSHSDSGASNNLMVGWDSDLASEEYNDKYNGHQLLPRRQEQTTTMFSKRLGPIDCKGINKETNKKAQRHIRYLSVGVSETQAVSDMSNNNQQSELANPVKELEDPAREENDRNDCNIHQAREEQEKEYFVDTTAQHQREEMGRTGSSLTGSNGESSRKESPIQRTELTEQLDEQSDSHLNVSDVCSDYLAESQKSEKLDKNEVKKELIYGQSSEDVQSIDNFCNDNQMDVPGSNSTTLINLNNEFDLDWQSVESVVQEVVSLARQYLSERSEIHRSSLQEPEFVTKEKENQQPALTMRIRNILGAIDKTAVKKGAREECDRQPSVHDSEYSNGVGSGAESVEVGMTGESEEKSQNDFVELNDLLVVTHSSCNSVGKESQQTSPSQQSSKTSSPHQQLNENTKTGEATERENYATRMSHAAEHHSHCSPCLSQPLQISESNDNYELDWSTQNHLVSLPCNVDLSVPNSCISSPDHRNIQLVSTLSSDSRIDQCPNGSCPNGSCPNDSTIVQHQQSADVILDLPLLGYSLQLPTKIDSSGKQRKRKTQKLVLTEKQIADGAVFIRALQNSIVKPEIEEEQEGEESQEYWNADKEAENTHDTVEITQQASLERGRSNESLGTNARMMRACLEQFANEVFPVREFPVPWWGGESEAVKQISTGELLVKFHRKQGKPALRYVWVDLEQHRLRWSSHTPTVAARPSGSRSVSRDPSAEPPPSRSNSFTRLFFKSPKSSSGSKTKDATQLNVQTSELESTSNQHFQRSESSSSLQVNRKRFSLSSAISGQSVIHEIPLSHVKGIVYSWKHDPTNAVTIVDKHFKKLRKSRRSANQDWDSDCNESINELKKNVYHRTFLLIVQQHQLPSLRPKSNSRSSSCPIQILQFTCTNDKQFYQWFTALQFAIQCSKSVDGSNPPITRQLQWETWQKLLWKKIRFQLARTTNHCATK